MWPALCTQMAKDAAATDAWVHLAHRLCRIIGVIKVEGRSYLRASSFQREADDILQLARPAYRLLQYSRDEVEWRNTASLRALLIPRRWDRPVCIGPVHQQLRREVTARCLVKFILTKSGHPLPPLSKIIKQDLYLLGPSFQATFSQTQQSTGKPHPSNSLPLERTSETASGHSKECLQHVSFNLEEKDQAFTAKSEECIEADMFDSSLGPYRLNMYHLEDNIQAMRLIPDGSVDTIITSPPFNKAGMYRSVTGKCLTVRQTPSTGSWHHGVPYQNYLDDLDEVRYQELQVEFLKECYRILKPRGLLFYHHAHRVAGGTEHGEEHLLNFQRAGLNLHQTVYWDQSGSVNYNEGRLTSVIETIYLLNRDPKVAPKCFHYAVHENFRTNRWKINKEKSSVHPCVFPALLVETCILLNSQEGDIIMDPYAGSGSTLLAAHNLKRRYIGFDISPEYQKSFNDLMQLDNEQPLAVAECE